MTISLLTAVHHAGVDQATDRQTLDRQTGRGQTIRGRIARRPTVCSWRDLRTTATTAT